MSTVYKKNDLVSREVVRRIIDSPRTQGQMLDMLASIPSAELSVIEDIKAEIHKVLDMTKIVETDSQRAQVIALSWVLELFDKHIGKESE